MNLKQIYFLFLINKRGCLYKPCQEGCKIFDKKACKLTGLVFDILDARMKEIELNKILKAETRRKELIEIAKDNYFRIWGLDTILEAIEGDELMEYHKLTNFLNGEN